MKLNLLKYFLPNLKVRSLKMCHDKQLEDITLTQKSLEKQCFQIH